MRILPLLSFYLFAIVLGNPLVTVAQAKMADSSTPRASQGLKIGDPLPEMILEMYGYHKDSMLLSGFRGKALILDFWATWCRPCVRDLPKLNTIQKAYNKDLSIVLVTRERRGEVDTFLGNIKGTIATDLPSVVGNNELLRLFNIRSLPQQVWVDKKGYIQAITYSEYLTEANLKDLLTGKAPKVPLKKGTLRGKLPMCQRPLFAQDTARPWDNNIIGYSYFSKYNDTLASAVGGFGPGEHSWSAAKTKLTIINMPPSSLYSMAYADLLGDIFFALGDRVVFSTPDSLKYRYPSNISNMEAQEWNFENTYCYDINVPVRDTGRLFEFMRSDLDRYFPLNAKIVSKKKKCLVLTPLNNRTKFSTNGGSTSRVFGQYYIKYNNVPMRQLITDLNMLMEGSIPLVSGIDYNGNIDLELKGDLSDPLALSRALGANNIKLNVDHKEFKLLVLTDKVKQ